MQTILVCDDDKQIVEAIDIYLVNPKAPCFIRDEKQQYIYLILPVNINAG